MRHPTDWHCQHSMQDWYKDDRGIGCHECEEGERGYGWFNQTLEEVARSMRWHRYASWASSRGMEPPPIDDDGA